jgi:hypothetical protein
VSDADAAAADGDAEGDADLDEEQDVPSVDEAERADVPDEIEALSEEVEDEVGLSDGPAADAEDGADAPDAGDEAAAEGETGAGDDAAEADTWGDWYVATVGVLAVAAAEELGDGETDRSEEDIAALLRAEPLNVDTNVDRLLEQMGHGTDLPPGQAVLLGTLAVVVVVVLTETDVASDLIGQLTNKLAETTDTESCSDLATK